MENAIKVKISSEERREGENLGNRKELVKAVSLIVNGDRGMRELICVRWYAGHSKTATRLYCTIWVSAEEFHISGTGMSGGYGYDKYVDSFQKAIEKAGITLTGNVEGVGEKKALEAIARAVGYERMLIVTHS